jgi:D-sedoheptulose 7-phosphate isomerase
MYSNPSQALDDLTASYPVLEGSTAALMATFECIRDSLRNAGTLYVCGNGGSAADCEHIAGEMLKGFLSKRELPRDLKHKLSLAGEQGHALASGLQQGLRCIALTGHPALTTAMANDVSADLTFAQQLNALGKAGDVLLAISTSGNARNVRLAALLARARCIKTVSLTGESGGPLAELADIAIRVPGCITHKIQELHLPVYHTLCAMLEVEFFSDA